MADSASLLWGTKSRPARDTTAATTTTTTTSVSPPPSATPEPEARGKDVETFSEINIEPWLVKTLETLSIVKPTPVQRMAIPLILAGRDVCSTACTGSGKTAAFALPIIQTLAKDPYGVYALTLTPTRELAQQVADQFRVFGSSFRVHVTTLLGGVEQQGQQRELERRPPIVVATPGRLRDTLKVHGVIRMFRRLRYLVFDEADRMLDESFEETIDDILTMLGPSTNRQTLLFSATVSADELAKSGALRRLRWETDSGVKDFSVVDTGQTEEGVYETARGLTEQCIFMPKAAKLCYLCHLIEDTRFPWRSGMIFVGSSRECEVVRHTMQELGLPVVSINSLLSQKQRSTSLTLFRLGKARLLVATDVASRGLDIPRVDLVINYDLPKLAKTYMHRAGRTARKDQEGRVVSLVTEGDVRAVHRIEKFTGRKWSKLDVDEEKCAEMFEDVLAARTRAKVNINHQFGERLREAEERKAPRDMRKMQQKEWEEMERKLGKQGERRPREDDDGDRPPVKKLKGAISKKPAGSEQPAAPQTNGAVVEGQKSKKKKKGKQQGEPTLPAKRDDAKAHAVNGVRSVNGSNGENGATAANGGEHHQDESPPRPFVTRNGQPVPMRTSKQEPLTVLGFLRQKNASARGGRKTRPTP
eukprot:Sspe_Gene.40601::Locus_19624_Transcript_1_1_Confidence_1.000_Length_2020::g.40601::m.40601/K14778/DDX49, DBP8; ATP-dependent RNA helicase DDX49/DBP8